MKTHKNRPRANTGKDEHRVKIELSPAQVGIIAVNEENRIINLGCEIMIYTDLRKEPK